MDAIRDDILAAFHDAGRDDVRVEFVLSPAWTTDWMSDEGKRKLLEYGIVPPQPRDAAPGGPHADPALPAVRLAGHPRAVPLRLHGVQVAVGVQRLPGALRPLQGHLMTTSHAVFHPLAVASIEPLTDDSVAITFDVPEDLRDDYAFGHGQHLTVRTELAGDDVRRNYSICSPAVVRGAPRRGQAAARRGVLRARARRARGSATCST